MYATEVNFVLVLYIQLHKYPDSTIRANEKGPRMEFMKFKEVSLTRKEKACNFHPKYFSTLCSSKLTECQKVRYESLRYRYEQDFHISSNGLFCKCK
jgi:hypothetical protein